MFLSLFNVFLFIYAGKKLPPPLSTPPFLHKTHCALENGATADKCKAARSAADRWHPASSGSALACPVKLHAKFDSIRRTLPLSFCLSHSRGSSFEILSVGCSSGAGTEEPAKHFSRAEGLSHVTGLVLPHTEMEGEGEVESAWPSDAQCPDDETSVCPPSPIFLHVSLAGVLERDETGSIDF